MQFRLRFPVVDRHGDVRPLKQAMLDGTAPRTWIHLAYEGEWQGHPAGEFEFTRQVFDQLVSNLARQKNPAPLTYEHPNYSGDGAPVPAAGWIHQLEVRDGSAGAELWGEVEFTERAAKFVRSGEYRFCSVVVDFDSIDRKSGEPIGPELYEVGLTNQPFIDGQRPIAFSRRTGAEGDDMKDPKELARGLVDAGLKLADGKTLKAMMQEAFRELGDEDPPIEKLIEFLRAKEAVERIKSGGEASSEEPSEEPSEMSDDAEDAVALSSNDVPGEPMPLEDGAPMAPEAFAQEVLAMLGVESLEEALAAIQAMRAPAEGEEAMMTRQLSALTRRVKELEGVNAQLTDERLRAEVETHLDKLTRVGTREETLKHYVEMAKVAPKLWDAQKQAAGIAGPKPPGKQLGRAAPGANSAVEDERAAMLRRLGYREASIQKALASKEN